MATEVIMDIKTLRVRVYTEAIRAPPPRGWWSPRKDTKNVNVHKSKRMQSKKLISTLGWEFYGSITGHIGLLSSIILRSEPKPAYHV